jgi:hypothetical protein
VIDPIRMTSPSSSRISPSLTDDDEEEDDQLDDDTGEDDVASDDEDEDEDEDDFDDEDDDDLAEPVPSAVHLRPEVAPRAG